MMAKQIKALQERLKEVYKENVELKKENLRLKKILADYTAKINKMERILLKYRQQKKLKVK